MAQKTVYNERYEVPRRIELRGDFHASAIYSALLPRQAVGLPLPTKIPMNDTARRLAGGQPNE